MKPAKNLSITALLTVSLSFGMWTGALAFHSGGVGPCEGCHTMHNSYGNMPMTNNGQPLFTVNAHLLQGTDASSTCLICHAGANVGPHAVATNPVPPPGYPPLQMTPGGDFAYLQKSYVWTTSTGTQGSSPGGNHGHNITALDFLYFNNSSYSVSPGGSYPTNNLSCVSCHDPHGTYRIMNAVNGTIATTGLPILDSGSYGALPSTNYAVGSYRLLAGNGYAPPSYPSSPFAADPPIAVSPAVYNRSEASGDTRVAYGKGMSEWCGNCHGTYHYGAVPSGITHPSGGAALLTNVAATYNAYIKTGDLTGTFATAYNSLVPFEEGTSDLAALALHTSSTEGASATNNVMCLTCHRAHASAWDRSARWNTAKGAYLTVNGAYPGIDAAAPGNNGEYATGKTQTEYQQAMYDRDASKFAAYQWSLCNKCHENDVNKQ